METKLEEIGLILSTSSMKTLRYLGDVVNIFGMN